MKKTVILIIALMVTLTGCSSSKKDVNNITKPAVNDTVINNNPGSGKTTKNDEVTNDDIISKSLQNIDTTKSQFEIGYYDYQGTINNTLPIHMSIYPLKGNIVGTYFYDKQRKEIKLVGKAGEKNILLYEYDEAGKNTGVFKGTLSTVDKIEGTWISADSKKSYPFTLSLKSNIPGVEYGKRYAVALNTKNDKDVENFASKIQKLVVDGDKKGFAAQIRYPINVKINGKVTKIQNKDDFIKNYDQIFNPNYKQAISNAYTKYMFVNWQGIMFGEGLYNIWINEQAPTGSDSKLMITAINN
ncbi:hypothetical protein G9F72_009100 [Clostridium estertheticum]|uniref:hypothetical protein n=1 Tax=Clostridium estertheticum TaxID=238834 RepID=UPI0013E95396|nr:hypothetical protein [Clostridium estertheticum]MBZ9686485.1 hypothetical protein [Clostridium estertheticum]